MGIVIGGIALLAILGWLLGAGGTRTVNPEDDVTTPIDREALAEAEQELLEDHDARPIGDELDDEDWGPGTGGKSGLPGLF